MPAKETLSESDLKFLKEDFLRLKRYGADTKPIESMLRDNGVGDDFFGSPKQAYAQPENEADDLRAMGQPDMGKMASGVFGSNQKDSEPASGRGPAVKTQTVSTQEGKAPAAPARAKVEAYAQPENEADDLRAMGQPDFLKAVEAAFGANQKDSEPASGRGPAVKTQTVSTQEGQSPPAAVDPMAFFKVTHGTKFDPKSRVDRAKLAVIATMLQKDPGLSKLSPNQFAAKVYRTR